MDTSGQLDFPKSRRVKIMGTIISIAIGSDVVQRALLALAITASAFAIKLKEKLIDLILHRTKVLYEASALLVVSYCSGIVQDLISLGKVFLQFESFFLDDPSIYRSVCRSCWFWSVPEQWRDGMAHPCGPFDDTFPHSRICARIHSDPWTTASEGGTCTKCNDRVCPACFLSEEDPPICTTCGQMKFNE